MKETGMDRQFQEKGKAVTIGVRGIGRCVVEEFR